MSDGDGVRWTVNESADKINLKTKVKRGTATRDQDTITVKVKADDPNDAAAKLANTLAALDAVGVTETLRETQPTVDDDAGDA